MSRGYAHRVDVVGDAEAVWEALTQTRDLARWCAPDAQMRAVAGGLFRASVDRVTEMEAHIDVFDPTRRLRLIYLPCDALPPAETALVDDFLLDARGEITIVRLLGSGIPRDPEWNEHFARLRIAWDRALARLKVWVESGRVG